MAQTRKSTPKHEVKTIHGDVTVYGPASKTDCLRVSRGMNKGRKAVYVWSVARNATVSPRA